MTMDLKSNILDKVQANIEEGYEKNKANDAVKDLTERQSYEMQELKDLANLEFIEKSFENGIIDEETKVFLQNCYSDTMYAYGTMYYALSASLGTPKGIGFRNLATGEVVPIMRENGRPVSESLRCVTPSTSIQIEFEDSYGNPIYLTLPGMKSAERAVEKVRIGGKYDLAYKTDVEKHRQRYVANNGWLFSKFVSSTTLKDLRKHNGNVKALCVDAYNKSVESLMALRAVSSVGSREDIYDVIKLVKEKHKNKDMSFLIDIDECMNKFSSKQKFSYAAAFLHRLEECVTREEKVSLGETYEKILTDDEQYSVEKGEIKKPFERLDDVFRGSISTKYYDNIVNMQKKMLSHFQVHRRDDKFLGNETPHHEDFQKNRKGYRDDKFIYILPMSDLDKSVKIEMQFKIQELEKADFVTHTIYEGLREIAENRDNADTNAEIAHLAMRAKELGIIKEYGDALRKYNRTVLTTAAKMEQDLFRADWKKKMSVPRNLQILEGMYEDRHYDKQKLATSYTDERVEKFIQDNYLVSPYVALNLQDDVANIAEYEVSPEKIEKLNGISKKVVIKDEVRDKPDMKNFIMRYFHVVNNKHKATVHGSIDREKYFADYDNAKQEVKNRVAENEKTNNNTLSSVVVGCSQKGR